MNEFTIQSEQSWFTNPTTNSRQRDFFLRRSVSAFYHTDYSTGGMWKSEGTIENMIWTLKNDVSPFPDRLIFAKQQLFAILVNDLPQILVNTGIPSFVVCVVPRSKKESYYNSNQLFFRQVVSNAANALVGFSDGTNYIIRHTNTRTTHLDRGGDGGDGDLPYPGITNHTCSISDNVRGMNILLIDDLYTRSVNIDEDAIQSLLDKGAKSVVFYSVGKTMASSY